MSRKPQGPWAFALIGLVAALTVLALLGGFWYVVAHFALKFW